MAEDSRESARREGATFTVPSGDANPNTVLDLRDEDTLALESVRLQYLNAGTTETLVTLYDEPSGTTSGNLSDEIDTVELSPGNDKLLDAFVWEDVEDDIVIEADGNQDADVLVTVGGYLVTG